MSREKYVKVLWLEEPRSVDTTLKTNVVEDEEYLIIAPGQERQVLYGDKPYPARVIATGTQTALKKLIVSRDGEILTDVGPDTRVLTSRSNALKILESRASNLQRHNEDELADLVLVAAVKERAEPQHARPDVLAEVKQQVKQLKCLKRPTEAEMNLMTDLQGCKVFIKRSTLNHIVRRYSRTPVKLFRALIRCLITREVFRKGCMSLGGSKHTVKLPPKIIKAALGYTTATSQQQHKSKKTKKDFNVSTTLTNLCGEYRRKMMRKNSEGGSADGDADSWTTDSEEEVDDPNGSGSP